MKIHLHIRLNMTEDALIKLESFMCWGLFSSLTVKGKSSPSSSVTEEASSLLTSLLLEPDPIKADQAASEASLCAGLASAACSALPQCL